MKKAAAKTEAAEPRVVEPAGLGEPQAHAWRLMLRWAEMVNRVEADVKGVDGMTLNGLFVLRALALAEATASRLTMNDLAARSNAAMGLSRSAVSRLTARLEESDWVFEDNLDEHDRGGDGRKRTIRISAEGVQAYKAAWFAYSRSVIQNFGLHLNETEAQVVVEAFERMLNPTMVKERLPINEDEAIETES